MVKDPTPAQLVCMGLLHAEGELNKRAGRQGAAGGVRRRVRQGDGQARLQPRRQLGYSPTSCTSSCAGRGRRTRSRNGRGEGTGSRRVVVLRRPARDLARRAHVHGLDLDHGQHLGRAHHAGRASFTKRLIFRGLGRDDHNNPSLVFRPDGRTGRVLLAALRPLPAAARHPQRDALPVSLAPSLDQRLRAGPHRAHQRARRPRLHLSEPDPAAGQAVAVLARRRLEPDVLLHARRPQMGAGARARALGGGQRPYAKYVGDGDRRIHGIFTDGHANALQEQPATTCATRTRSCSRRAGGGSGHCARCRCTSPSSTTSTGSPTPGGSAWPHDIALTSEGRPRIVYTRRVGHRDTFYYAYHNGESGSAARSSRPAPGFQLLHLRRGDARPRGPALRLPLAARSARGTRSRRGSRPTTAARGRSRQLTATADHYCIRPVTPRGLRGANMVLFSRGDRRRGLHRLPHAHPRAAGRRAAGLAAPRRDAPSPRVRSGIESNTVFGSVRTLMRLPQQLGDALLAATDTARSVDRSVRETLAALRDVASDVERVRATVEPQHARVAAIESGPPRRRRRGRADPRDRRAAAPAGRGDPARRGSAGGAPGRAAAGAPDGRGHCRGGDRPAARP